MIYKILQYPLVSDWLHSMDLVYLARRLCGAVALSALLVTGPVAAAPTTQDQSGWYEDALVRFHDGDYPGALIQLKNVLQENPTNLSARILLGRTQLLLGAPADAEKELESAIRMGADDELTIGYLAQAYLQQHRYKEVLAKILPGDRSPRVEAAVIAARATAYYELYRYEDALQDFESATKLDPTDPVPLLGIARVLVRQGHYDKAAAIVDQAAALGPGHPDVWYVRGELFKIHNDRSAAVQSFSRAIELVPSHFPARIARASVLLQLGRSAEAVEDLQYVRKFDRLDSQAAYFMALALAREGDIRGARDALDEADLIIRNTEPGFIRSHAPTMLVAGMVSYARGKFDEAQVYLRDYVGLVPNHVGAMRLLSSILLKKKEPKQAKELLERVLKLEPDNWRAHALMGAALMQLNQVSEATEQLERAAELNPEGTTIRTRLAMSKLIGGDSALAIDELHTALERNPKAQRPAALLGFMHLRRGEFQQAIEVADKLLADNPRNPLALNLRGGALIAQGDRAAGRASFEQALKAVPNYRPALSNLARLEISEGNVGKARQIYLDALKRNVNDAKAMQALGQLAELENNLELAVQWYEKAIAADRKDVAMQLKLIQVYDRMGQTDRVKYLTHELKQAHSGDIRVLEAIGKLELSSGEKDKAVKTFQRMANMRPDSANDLSRIAKLQLAADDTEGAYNTLRRAVWVAPDHQAALSSLVRLEARTRRADEALKRAQQLRIDRPQSDLGDQLLGEVLVSLKRYDEAIEAFQAALTKAEVTANVLRLHLAQRAAGRYGEALATLQQWQAKFGNDPRYARALAAAYIDTRDYAVAIREHELLLEAAPNDAGLINNLAWLYEETGDSRALATAERAYRLKPGAPEVMDTLGWILVQRGDAARGLTLLREAHARSSVDAGIRYHLAVALARLGRKTEAVSQLREVMRGDDSRVKARAETLMQELDG